MQIHSRGVYWLEFFPKLPSYSAFNRRINRLGSAFSVLAELYQSQYPEEVFHHKHFQTYCDYKLYNIYKVLKTIVMSSPFDLRANKQ